MSEKTKEVKKFQDTMYTVSVSRKRQSAPISVLIKPIGLCGTQNTQFKKKIGALCRIPGHATPMYNSHASYRHFWGQQLGFGQEH